MVQVVPLSSPSPRVLYRAVMPAEAERSRFCGGSPLAAVEAGLGVVARLSQQQLLLLLLQQQLLLLLLLQQQLLLLLLLQL
jgi:hypothetical protein